MLADEPSALPSCQSCGREMQVTDRFCGHCGCEVSIESVGPREDVFSILTPSLFYYFTTLSLLATYKLTSIFGEDFESFLFINVIDVLIVIAFALYAYKDIRPLFSFKGFRISIATLTIGGALVGSIFISWLANIINIAISDDVFYDTYLFSETSSPLLFATFFICVLPAVFEEIAFRGFLFNNIQKLSSPLGTVYITSFIFGIIHLAIVSMLWLVPIGLAFAFLRMRYNTIWYGVLGHFTYNFGITLLEFFFADFFVP